VSAPGAAPMPAPLWRSGLHASHDVQSPAAPHWPHPTWHPGVAALLPGSQCQRTHQQVRPGRQRQCPPPAPAGPQGLSLRRGSPDAGTAAVSGFELCACCHLDPRQGPSGSDLNAAALGQLASEQHGFADASGTTRRSASTGGLQHPVNSPAT
jgi:hypothetical protein